MDSSAFVIDRTFPIDLSESSNPDLLTEVTYGEVGIAPMMEKSSTGRMSPVRGRTMKEYDQQLAELKKENFNLKLRIYFMEERMNTKFNEEDVIKTNIELKVEMENYKKDLVEKQALLEKASETIDTLTGKYSEELEKEVINIKQECDDNVQQANQRVYELENELSTLDEKLHELQDECNNLLKPSLERKDKQIQELTINLEDRDKEIGSLEDKVKVLKQEVAELRGQAERREEQFLEERESLRTNLGRRDRDIQDEVADSRRGNERLQMNNDKQQHDLDKKGQMIGKLEDLLRIKEKEKQGLKKAYEDRTAVYKRSKAIISNLAQEAHERERKIKLQENDLHILEDELGKAQDQLQQANIHRQKDADKIGELEDKLEKLVRTLGKREGELENFRDLLEKAQRSLSMSEAAVECLQTQLEKDRCRCKKENNEIGEQGDMARLRQELANLHVQLDEREKQYQSKCAELDTVAQRLDIKVTSQSNGSDQSDMLQRIMGELRQLKGAMESERHLHIDINSAHMSNRTDASQAQSPRMDGSRAHSTRVDGSQSRSPRVDGSQSRSPRVDGSQSRSPYMDGSQAISTYTSDDKDGSVAHSKHPATHMDNLQALGIDRDDNPLSGLYHKPTVMGKNGSRIPVRRGSSTSSCSDEVDSLRHHVADLSARNHDLENTLKATEETVRCQTQKMKHYRSMLVDNNLLPRSRSNSVPNIASMTGKESLSPMLEAQNGRQRPLLVESAAMRCRSVSPTPVSRKRQFNDEYQGDGADRLSKENCKLKQQIDGYRRVLKVFQGRSPSPESDSDKSGQDGEPTPISIESASCLLEGWLDMLDKFLTELSQSDQEGQSPLVTSTMEITRLRRGLVQARGAIQTLSETSLVAQEKLSEGRLSPDSGCSDNPTSAQNTLKESSLNSPSSEHSVASPRSDITSPGSEAGAQLAGDYGKNKLINDSDSRLVPGCENTTEDKSRHHSQLSTNSASAANQSPPGLNSNFDHKNRDAGVDPRLSSLNSFQSVERLRQFSGFTNSKNVSVFSHNDIDNSVFSMRSGPRVSNVYRKPIMTKLPSASMDNSALNELKQTNHKPSYLDRFEQTFSPSFLGGEGDETFGDITTNTGRLSLIRFEEGSILDITSQDNMRNKTSTAEMQERIRSLEDIIHTYEEQIRQQSRPDMDSLQQQLIELRNLRIQLEKSMEQNEILERQLAELYQFSECTIHDLKSQLAESNDHVREKMRLITEKERVITETTGSLVKYRDNAARHSADLHLCKDKVRSLESELKSSKVVCEQLTSMCQQLKTAVEQYKRRSEQLENDNKKHMDAVFRYQNKVKDLEEEIKSQANSMTESLRSRLHEADIEVESMRSRLHEADIEVESMRSRLDEADIESESQRSRLHEAGVETESLRSRLHEVGIETKSLKSHVLELENSGQQWRENEAKYKALLSQTRLQVTELSADLEIMRSELRKHDAELHTVRAELESSRDTVEEQNQHLYDKSSVINNLKVEMTEKTSILHEQDSLCQDLTGKLESTTTMNGKLVAQLEQQRLTCADYKLQIEKQNNLTKDLKDRIDKLREELSQSIHTRESLDKLMMERQKEFQETTRLKDKYLYNLKVTYKEFTKTKKDLKEVQKKCEDTDVLNSTLQTELSVRERLMEGKGDMLTDDDKQSMIAELLNELKLARIQMTKILEQNETIKKRMSELIEQLIEQRSSQQSTSSTRVEAAVNKSLTDELPDISLGANQTWPLYGDLLGGLPRTDNLSCSLPLRESTPGGPASINSRLSRRSDIPSQQLRQSDFPAMQNLQRQKHKLSSADLPQNVTQSHQDSLSSSFEMELNQSTKSYTEEPVSSSGNHFSIPGPIYKQGITDNCLLYNVNDSPKYLAGLTQITIDSDVRSLFAVGMIDHFEKLRKEAHESNAILKGLSTRINERLKVFAVMPATESVEYSTLKELSYATDNMRICVDSQMSLIGCFWTSELPAPNERGEFVNQKLLDQNCALREELCILMDRTGKDCARLKSKMNEEQIYKSLESTLDVVTRAKQNFQHQQTPRMYSPHRSPSHSPRK